MGNMHPTSLDLKAIQLLAPFQAKPFCVDAADILSQNSLVNGLVYAVPLFLLWHSADADQRSLAQRMMLTILIVTIIGALGSTLLQLRIRRPPRGKPRPYVAAGAQLGRHSHSIGRCVTFGASRGRPKDNPG